MKFIRSVCMMLLFLFFGLGALLISFVIFPLIGMFSRKQIRKKCFSKTIHNCWKFFVWLIQITGMIKVNVEDEEQIKNISGKVIVASHPSFIDIVILISLIPNSICLAKEGLSKNIFMRNIVKAIYITNDVDIEQFKNDTDAALREGFNIIIFPTGKRTNPDEDIKIHKGAALIAINSGVNVVPISLKCSYKFLGINQSILEAGDKTAVYTLRLMPEIDINELKKEEMTDISLRNHISKIIKKSIS